VIKLKDILKEEMSSSDKRDMKSSTRNIDFHVGYIEKEIKKLGKILNKEGLRKSSGELDKSFKSKVLEFQKDVRNISAQHLQEAFPPSSLGSSTYSKIIGQAQKRVVDIFTSDLKNKKYDRIDLSRSIHKGNIRDTSFSKRAVLKQLFYDLKDRFVQYGRRKK
jgi:hypothetical protein